MSELSKPSLARRVTGVLRILFGLVVFSMVVWQVADRIANNVFRPAEYFSYFTIQSCLAMAVVFVAAGIYALKHATDTRLLTIARMSIFAYAIVVMVVYNLLLRNEPPSAEDVGYAWPVVPNEIEHVWAPILVAVDWILGPGRFPLRIRAMWWALVYPLAWVAFSLVRGAITGWWVYPFLDPNGPDGVLGVVIYVIGISVFMAFNAFIALFIGWVWTRSQRKSNRATT
jgi:hypothetical protein